MYVDKLKRVYQTPPTTWLPLPISKHIKLAMTKEKGMRYGREADKLTTHRVKGELEQVMACKVPVDRDSIFDDGIFKNTCRPLVILVEGALGSGKTTLAHHYCHEWANGNLAMFDLVALVYLRHPAVHSAGPSMSLDELLLVASGNDDEKEIVGTVAQSVKNSLKCLIIFDGWDEAPACLRASPDLSCPPDNSFLGKLLRSVSSNTTILITSRPDSSLDLHKRPNVNRVEILGFTKESFHEYFREALSTQLSSDEVTVECSKLEEHFSKYPAIESICYIPLNAAILTLVYLERNHTLPTTQYELFYEVLLCGIYNEVHTRQPNRTIKLSICSLDDLPLDLKEHINNISKLAYEGIMQNKVVFSQNELSTLLPQPDQQDLPAMGVLQKVQWAGSRSKIMFYNFSHLSIQELLAAYFISKMRESEQVSAFQSLRGNPRFDAVLQFYAWFTKLANQGVQHILTGRDFFRDKSSKRTLCDYLECFFDTQITNESLYRKFLSRMSNKLDLEGVNLYKQEYTCMSIGYFLAIASRHSSDLTLNLDTCVLDDHSFGLLLAEYSKHAEGRSVLHGVTELNLRSNKFVNACTIAKILQTNTNLRLLDIAYWPFSYEGVESLARGLAVNKSLQELNISHNRFGDYGIAHIATALLTNTTLRTLNISCCGMSDVGVELLVRALAVNRSLEELDIKSNKISGNGIAYLLKNTALKTLHINISDDGAESLARALAENVPLEKLDISSDKLSDKTAFHISTALQTNNILRTLNMVWCGISDDGAESLARALAVNSSLQELDISDNEIGDNGIAYIATVLKTNTTLRKLGISSCGISDKGMESLIRALAVNQSLQELDISGNEFGDIGMALITTAFQTSTTLKTLETSVTPFSLTSSVASLECYDLHNYTIELKFSESATGRNEEFSSSDNTQGLLELVHQTQEWFRLRGINKLVQSLKKNFLVILILHVSTYMRTSDLLIQALEAAASSLAAKTNTTRRENGLSDIGFDIKQQFCTVYMRSLLRALSFN